MVTSDYKVQDFMNKHIIFCSEEDSLKQVCELMYKNAISTVIVRESEKLISKDKLIESLANGSTLDTSVKNAKVYREMFTCPPETDIMKAFELINKHKTRRLCVKENGKLVGIISMKDIFFVAPMLFDLLEYKEAMKKTRTAKGKGYRIMEMN